MPTQKFRIRGLKHEDEEAVARRLRAMDGVFSAVLSHTDESASVDFEDDRAGLGEIRAVIREMGYEAELAG